MSTVRRGGLGKGLGALIPTSGAPASGVAIDAILGDRQAPVRVPGASFQEIPVARVVPNPRQPRQHFDEDALAELQASIAAFGLLQPIVVRPSGDVYELVMGERRWRAAKEIGLDAVPAIVRDTADDAMLRDALLENLHRQQLNPLEEAAAYQQLLQEFGSTHEDLASRIGRSRSQVSNTIRLLNLPVPVQRRVAAGVLSAGHARALLALADGDRQEELAGRIVAEGLSVRATEELVSVGGAAPPPGRPPRTVRLRAPALVHLAEQLSDAFDTSVKVELGRRKGRVVVEFASVDDLQRIIALMSPAITQRAQLTELSTVDSAGPDQDAAAEPAPDDPAAAGDQSTVDMREERPAPAATTDSGRHAAAESGYGYGGVRP